MHCMQIQKICFSPKVPIQLYGPWSWFGPSRVHFVKWGHIDLNKNRSRPIKNRFGPQWKTIQPLGAYRPSSLEPFCLKLVGPWKHMKVTMKKPRHTVCREILLTIFLLFMLHGPTETMSVLSWPRRKLRVWNKMLKKVSKIEKIQQETIECLLAKLRLYSNRPRTLQYLIAKNISFP